MLFLRNCVKSVDSGPRQRKWPPAQTIVSISRVVRMQICFLWNILLASLCANGYSPSVIHELIQSPLSLQLSCATFPSAISTPKPPSNTSIPRQRFLSHLLKFLCFCVKHCCCSRSARARNPPRRRRWTRCNQRSTVFPAFKSRTVCRYSENMSNGKYF